ncbi:hypothetical protein [Cyanobium gracile]|uniref:PEP-CTERM sorting domain-containing protein n=1 Tax=Cyanobium gracile UHCC 0281 TaxID=3110309 RepID=A0ABU5SUH1_9CYAN|nr:hypothetical protein [Cyanobium gracile]MEA5442053.1 hypothetical protein [Cyanobium gracile UHCC 0281]
MLSLRTPIGLGAALSASLAASLLSVAPAQAQEFAPSGNEWPGGVDGSSKPANCTAFTPGATIFSGDFACTSGDKIYSSFFLTTDTGGALNSGVFNFTFSGTNHTLAALANFAPGTYEFGYTMTIFDALNSGQRLESANTSATSSVIGSNIPAWTKTLNVSTNDEILDITTTQSQPIIVNSNGPKTFGVAVQPVSADFISKLIVANLPSNSVQGITDSVTQKFDDGETVPGPLPILGAGAAFGLSRKLRRRIKQTA